MNEIESELFSSNFKDVSIEHVEIADRAELWRLSDCYMQMQLPHLSIKLLERLQSCEKDVETEAILIINRARSYIFMNKPKAGLSMLESVELSKWLFLSNELSAWTYATAALAYQHQHKWIDVHRNISFAVKKLSECRNATDQFIQLHINILSILANYYAYSNQTSKALRSAQTVGRLIVNKSPEILDSYQALLPNTYGFIGQLLLSYDQAIAYKAFCRQHELSEALQIPALMISAYSNLVNFYRQTNQKELQRSFLQKEHQLLEANKSGTLEYLIRWDYADSLVDSGDIHLAIIEYEKALILVQEFELEKEEAEICYRLAEVSRLIDLRSALTYYHQCFDVWLQLSCYRRPIEACVEKLAKVTFNLGDYEQAVEYAQKISENSKADVRRRTRCNLILAQSFLETGRRDEALEFFKSSVELAKENSLRHELGSCEKFLMEKLNRFDNTNILDWHHERSTNGKQVELECFASEKMERKDDTKISHCVESPNDEMDEISADPYHELRAKIRRSQRSIQFWSRSSSRGSLNKPEKAMTTNSDGAKVLGVALPSS
ncbi:hypothetical protein M3Y95_00097400 [Aphelenchoides besseyi]|nr:hypothetical protein M3Y95_00097400 [Aphelenchoides besseyi]